jgi:hypothetical protein
MRQFLTRLVIIVIVLFIMITFNFIKVSNKKTLPNVVIIVLSGASNSESFKNMEFMPNLWRTISGEGTVYSKVIPLDCQFHMPVVSAILTGLVYPLSSDLRAPSIFQYVQKKYSLPEEKLWVIGEWDTNAFIYESEDFTSDSFPSQMAALSYDMSDSAFELLNEKEKTFVEKYKKLEEGWPQWDSLSSMQFTIFSKILKAHKPILAVDIMNDIESGHYGTYARYVTALKKIDARLYQIWEMIQNDPIYKNNTYLIITTDHARNDYYMQHSDSIGEMAQPTWIYIYGPGIKKGVVIERPVYHIDIFPTLAKIFKVNTHENRGSTLTDSFEN